MSLQTGSTTTSNDEKSKIMTARKDWIETLKKLMTKEEYERFMNKPGIKKLLASTP